MESGDVKFYRLNQVLLNRIPIFATKQPAMYRLDRNAFTIQTFESAADQRAYWLTKTPGERLAAAWYLTCTAWNLDASVEQRLDRSCFSIRIRKEHAPEHI